MPENEKAECLIMDLGRISYSRALEMQLGFHAKVVSGEMPGMLMLLEHDPVITLGVGSSRSNILASDEMLEAEGVEVTDTDRGGDVTYHGPGQLVGYPILRFRELGCDLTSYLRRLEDCVIATLAHYGLSGERNGLAGVWVGGKKVCSIGVAVRKWVSYHGFALNVNPKMPHFSLINPCGLDAQNMTSLALLLGEDPGIADVKSAFARSFSDVFGVSLESFSGRDN